MNTGMVFSLFFAAAVAQPVPDADADAALLYAGYGYGHGLGGYGLISPSASLSIRGLAPAALPAVVGGYAGAGRYHANSAGVVHLAKREAEEGSEPEPEPESEPEADD